MKKFVSQGTGSLLIAIGFALLIRWAFMEAYVIPSGSMLPTLLVNDHIFVNKASFGLRVPFTSDWLFSWGQPSRGDVIVFRYPADPRYYYIKRVIGVPGDLIEYRKGYVYINGELVERLVPSGSVKADWQWLSDTSFIGDQNGLSDYTHWQESIGQTTYSVLLNEQGSRQIEYEPFRVPDRHFFVMGDNRDNSQDSRHWASRERRAKGYVTFRLQTDLKDPVQVTQGTIVKTDLIRGLSRRYRTLKEVTVSPGKGAGVEVEALSPGLEHNISAQQIKNIESEPLNGLVLVSNIDPILGGEDFRYVPRSYIVGRAMFVWLSCEKMLPVLSFMCDPTALRWSRFFHDID
jgi:signal peptidase I